MLDLVLIDVLLRISLLFGTSCGSPAVELVKIALTCARVLLAFAGLAPPLAIAAAPDS